MLLTCLAALRIQATRPSDRDVIRNLKPNDGLHKFNIEFDRFHQLSMLKQVNSIYMGCA